MSAERCPCGFGEPYLSCCAPLIDGLLDGVSAPTALTLMRSRYTAFVRGAIDYLLATHDPSTRGSVDRASITAWSAATHWQGLEIIETVRGGADDRDGVVEFVARGRTNGTPFAQRERSRFSRGDDGRWFYVDGTFKKA